MIRSIPIRAELTGRWSAQALGFEIKGRKAPVLSLCRTLVAHGIHGRAPMECWRGDTLCLRIRSIGEAAEFTLGTTKSGRPVFHPRSSHDDTSTPEADDA